LILKPSTSGATIDVSLNAIAASHHPLSLLCDCYQMTQTPQISTSSEPDRIDLLIDQVGRLTEGLTEFQATMQESLTEFRTVMTQSMTEFRKPLEEAESFS